MSTAVFISFFLLGLVLIERGGFPDGVAGSGTAPFAVTTFGAILTRNLFIAILCFIGGPAIGIVTVPLLAYNGAVLGAIVVYGLEYGLSPLGVALTLVPHAPIEIAGFLFAASAGLRLPYELLRYLRRDREYPLDRSVATEITCLFALGLGLVVLAAVLETTVTAWVTTWLVG